MTQESPKFSTESHSPGLIRRTGRMILRAIDRMGEPNTGEAGLRLPNRLTEEQAESFAKEHNLTPYEIPEEK